ncbi:hypothetical protein [Prosthecobacter sp.]|uniref:hypothetical protein n=1 Tax=Prosthecobacter sp. TaxID=1965333 RepID=UPI001D22D6F0|nr:hypothetical protein [Prosthecobacter sp.]MCB1274923.1 hypothetical protein [Prosthecobacter sp.]
MHRRLLLLALTGLTLALAACAYPSRFPRIQWVSTARVVPFTPGVAGPLYTINGVAMQQYSPSLYTPFLYDHRSLASNTYYHDRAVRDAMRKNGMVHVGPMVLQSSANLPPSYEVRRAKALLQ